MVLRTYQLCRMRRAAEKVTLLEVIANFRALF